MRKFVYAVLLLGLISIQSEDTINGDIRASLNHPSKHATKTDSTNQDKGKSDENSQPPVSSASKSDTGKSSNEDGKQRVKREEKDLEAQISMANSAKESVAYTLIGLIITGVIGLISIVTSVVGIVFSIRSLRQSRTIHDRTIDEMRGAEQRAARHSELDIRAYIKVECIVKNKSVLNRIMKNPGQPLNGQAYIIKIENVGRSPARGLGVISLACLNKWEEPDENTFNIREDDIDQRITRITLSPGSFTTSDITFRDFAVPASFAEKLEAKTHGVFVYGLITFSDVFGNPQSVRFRFVHNVREDREFHDYDILLHYKGNEAT